MHSYPNLEPVCCSMPSSNCCFLTCIQVFQETGKIWYSHVLENFPLFVVIHTVKGFCRSRCFSGIVLLFTMIQWMLASWFLVRLPFLNPAYTSGSSWFMYCLKTSLEDFEHYFASTWNEYNCAVVWTWFGIALLWDWNENWKKEGIYVFLELIHIVV